MADLSKIKIQKIKVAGLAIYPATILDAVKDATAKITVNGEEKDNPSYGKTLREIIVENEKVTASALTELDSRAGKLADLSTTEKGSLVVAINEVASSASGATGALSDLTTDAKDDLVSAINELDAAIDKLDGAETVEGSVKAQLAALKKEIMTGEATGTVAEAYDTLKEIADWISANDANGEATGLTKQVATNTAAIGKEAIAAETVTTEEYDALSNEEQEAYELRNGEYVKKGTGIAATGLYKEVADIKSEMAADAVTVSATDGVTKNGVTYKYVHPTTTAADAAAVKVGKDAEGHVVLGDALAAGDIAATAIAASDDQIAFDGTTVAAQLGNAATAIKTVADAVEGKNVDAEGDDFVSASADANKVTVATTTATIASQATEGADNGLTTASDVYSYALTAVATTDTTEYADVF